MSSQLHWVIRAVNFEFSSSATSSLRVIRIISKRQHGCLFVQSDLLGRFGLENRAHVFLTFSQNPKNVTFYVFFESSHALSRTLVGHWAALVAEVGGSRWCHLAVAVLSASTSSQWPSSSPVERQPTAVSPSGSSVASRPSLNTASSTRVSASVDLSTPNTSASFQTGLLVWRFVVVFFRFRRTVVAGLLTLPTPMVTVTRTSGPATNTSLLATTQRLTDDRCFETFQQNSQASPRWSISCRVGR